MTSEFEAITKAAEEKRRQQDIEDYNNEAAGRDTGRMKRFGVGRALEEAAQEEKRKKATLEQLMLDQAYRAAWTGAMDAINQADEAVYDALIRVNNDLSLASASHQDLLGRATKTESGIRVFRDKHSKTFTEHGEVVSQDLAESIEWKEGSPTWEEHNASQDRLIHAQESYDDVSAKSDRIAEIREEMENEDDPLSIEEVKAIELEAKEIYQSLNVSVDQDVTLEKAAAPAVVPDLNLNF